MPMVGTRSFKVDIGPSWELVDALISLHDLREVLPLLLWLSVSRTITADLTWPEPMTEMPKRAHTWVLDDPYRPPSPMVAHLAISIHIIYTLAQTKIRHSREINTPVHDGLHSGRISRMIVIVYAAHSHPC